MDGCSWMVGRPPAASMLLRWLSPAESSDMMAASCGCQPPAPPGCPSTLRRGKEGRAGAAGAAPALLPLASTLPGTGWRGPPPSAAAVPAAAAAAAVAAAAEAASQRLRSRAELSSDMRRLTARRFRLARSGMAFMMEGSECSGACCLEREKAAALSSAATRRAWRTGLLQRVRREKEARVAFSRGPKGRVGGRSVLGRSWPAVLARAWQAARKAPSSCAQSWEHVGGAASHRCLTEQPAPHLTVVVSGCRLRGRSSRRPSTTSGRPRQPPRTAAWGSSKCAAQWSAGRASAHPSQGGGSSPTPLPKHTRQQPPLTL